MSEIDRLSAVDKDALAVNHVAARTVWIAHPRSLQYADPAEEMGLDNAVQVVRLDILDAPRVDVCCRKVAGGDDLPEPGGREGVDLVQVVERGHAAPPFCFVAAK